MSVKLNGRCKYCHFDGELYICLTPECLKSKKEQVSCFKCFHKNHNSEIHIPEECKIVQHKSEANQKELLKILEECIRENKIEQENYEKDIDQLSMQVTKWFQDQKKLIRDFYEREDRNMKNELTKTQNFNTSFEQQIQLYSCNINDKIELIEKRNSQFLRFKTFEMQELQFKIKYLTQTKLMISQLGNQESSYLQLNQNQQNQSQSLYCQNHNTQKAYLCTNKECLNKNHNCFCKFCILENKICHDEKDLKNLNAIKSMLEQKKQFAIQQYKDSQIQIQNQIDNYFDKKWKNQQNQTLNVLDTKSLLMIEMEAQNSLQQVYINFLKIKPYNPNFYDKSQEQIKSELQNGYMILMKNLENDQQYLQKQSQINHQNQDITRQKSHTLHQPQTQISQYYDSELNLNTANAKVYSTKNKQITITEMLHIDQSISRPITPIQSTKSDTIQKKKQDFGAQQQIQQPSTYRQVPTRSSEDLERYYYLKPQPSTPNLYQRKGYFQNRTSQPEADDFKI